MPRKFNTAGPINPVRHYCIDPFTRIDWPEIEMLIDDEKYFVLHAPRQTGKTTLLNAIVARLNEEKRHEALCVNVEAAQVARDDVRWGIKAIIGIIGMQAEYFLPNSWIASNWKSAVVDADPLGAFVLLLRQWAAESSLPIVLLIDEIDSLVGDTLVSVLRQLRTGYIDRPAPFPQSVILCGVRDVRDYRIHTSSGDIITGGSCFNVKAKSLRLGNFGIDDVKNLYGQHQAETGQVFKDDIYTRVMDLTGGQPWLVNALANEVTDEMREFRDRTRSIGVEEIEVAKERLILARATHLDQLLDKLKEDRVRRIIEPMLQCEEEELGQFVSEDDILYVADLGLISLSGPRKGQIANEIYREVIPRSLTFAAQIQLHSIVSDTAFHLPNGKLDLRNMLAGFQQFYRQNSEWWKKLTIYEEAAPQLLLQAWLQRVINGGGQIEREYALGRKRVDLFVRYYYQENNKRKEQRFVVELKRKTGRSSKTIIKDGIQQTAEYADKCNSDEAHLLVVDHTEGKSWDEKVFVEEHKCKGRTITVWGM